LVQRYNGTAAGLGYLEVLELSKQILLVSALSIPNGEEGYNPSSDLNPITNSPIQLQCVQAIKAHIQPTISHKQTPSEMLYVNLLLNNLNTVPIYEIKK
jgi:hypothetical protein